MVPEHPQSEVLVAFQVLWFEAETFLRGEHCHIVYINQASGHVQATGSAKFLVGESCTAWKQCLVPQGRCKVTGATWPGCEQTAVTTGSAAEIRTEYLTLSVTGGTYSSFVWLDCTASMSGKNMLETQNKKTNNMQSLNTVPAGSDAAHNCCD